MSKTYRLVQRQGTWYYRRRVPRHLAATFGKVVQFSLGTKDLKAAKQRRTVAELEWDARFATEEDRLAQADAPAQEGEPLPTSTAVELIRTYVERMDRRTTERLLAKAPATQAERRSMVEDADYGLQMLRNLDDPRGAERVFVTGQKVLTEAGTPSPTDTAFDELVRRCLIELDRRKLARLTDDPGRGYHDPLFDPARPPDMAFCELTEQYLGLKRDEASSTGTSAKYLDKLHANVALIREIIGPATLVRDVDYDACLQARAMLAEVPANRGRVYGDMPLPDAIQRGHAEGNRHSGRSLSSNISGP